MHRTGVHGRDQHAGHGEVDAVELLAGDLVDGVEPLQRLAGDRPVLRILELHFLRRLELGRRRGDGAIGGLLARAVGDDAVGGGAFARRHLPVGRGRCDQHLAGHGAALADILVAFTDAAAAAGREILPDAVALQVLARGRILPGDFGPVAIQLFGDELGEAGQRALSHLRARDADHHLVVGMDHHPGVDLLNLRGMGRHEGNGKAQREAASDGSAAHQEAPSVEGRAAQRQAAERALDRHDASSP